MYVLLAALLFVQPGSPGAEPPSEGAVPNEVPRGSDGEYGPFFEEEAVSDTAFPTTPRGLAPVLSVKDGGFCFVEDAHCRAALISSADVGIGVAAVGQNGPDMPYSQFTFRGGITARPMTLAKGAWHPWSAGVVGSWSMGTGGIRVAEDDVTEAARTQGFRVGLMNQIWLSHKKNAFHLDFTLGGIRSGVLGPNEQIFKLWGTHAEVAVGFGGWGALVASADFLDQDTRVVFGFRMHGLAGIPVVGLLAAGLAAGGTLR